MLDTLRARVQAVLVCLYMILSGLAAERANAEGFVAIQSLKGHNDPHRYVNVNSNNEIDFGSLAEDRSRWEMIPVDQGFQLRHKDTQKYLSRKGKNPIFVVVSNEPAPWLIDRKDGYFRLLDPKRKTPLAVH